MVKIDLRDPNLIENAKAIMGLKQFGYSEEELQKLYDEQVKADKEKNEDSEGMNGERTEF